AGRRRARPAGERCVHGAAGGGTAALCGRRAGAYARFPVRPPHTPAGLRARENRSRRARPRRARVRGHARARTRRAAAMALHGRLHRARALGGRLDRKSTRLNSSHLGISYAVFCLKKKKKYKKKTLLLKTLKIKIYKLNIYK